MMCSVLSEVVVTEECGDVKRRGDCVRGVSMAMRPELSDAGGDGAFSGGGEDDSKESK